MATETTQNYAKKEYKNLSTFEKIMQGFVPIGAILIGVITILFLFVFEQNCGPIDKEFVWCEVHPFGFFDVIGLTLFYLGLLWLSGTLPKLCITLFRLDDDQSLGRPLNLVAFIFLLGFFLIYA